MLTPSAQSEGWTAEAIAGKKGNASGPPLSASSVLSAHVPCRTGGEDFVSLSAAGGEVLLDDDSRSARPLELVSDDDSAGSYSTVSTHDQRDREEDDWVSVSETASTIASPHPNNLLRIEIPDILNGNNGNFDREICYTEPSQVITATPRASAARRVVEGGDVDVDDDDNNDDPPPPLLRSRSPRFLRDSFRGATAFNFSFSGGGWIQYYMFGVAACIQDHGLAAVDDRQQFLGVSAGGFAAACLALDGNFLESLKFSKEVALPAVHSSSFWGAFKVTEFLKQSMHKVVNFNRVWNLMRGELALGVTRVNGIFLKQEIIREFESEEHIVKALLASSAIIPLAKPVKMHGAWYIDGGFTQLLLKLPSPEEKPDLLETIYVESSYFANGDIKPSQAIPWSWSVVPPKNPENIDWMYGLGYRDALKWMDDRGLSFLLQPRAFG